MMMQIAIEIVKIVMEIVKIAMEIVNAVMRVTMKLHNERRKNRYNFSQ